MSKLRRRERREARERAVAPPVHIDDLEPDWSAECDVCGGGPVHPMTGMCGPCSFGEADTIGGDW